jgi:DNA repair protein RecO (recombination protein O)
MGLYKVEGVVLRRRNLGETDRLVTLLTRERGKVVVVARGARRPRSRLGGRLEPAARVRALVAEGRTLDTVSQVEVLEANATLRTDLHRLGIASILLEMTDRALADRQPHPEVYRLLRVALSMVRHGRAEFVWPWFAARLLVLLGHRPALVHCQGCGHRVRGAALWSRRLGGCLHTTCRVHDPAAMAISAPARALLVFLLDANPGALRRIAPAPRDLAVACEVLREHAESCWETKLRAPGVVERVAGAPGGVSAAR